jgi:hypothetical protein
MPCTMNVLLKGKEAASPLITYTPKLIYLGHIFESASLNIVCQSVKGHKGMI